MTSEEKARRLRRVYSLLLSLNGGGSERAAGRGNPDSDPRPAVSDTLPEEVEEEHRGQGTANDLLALS